MGLQNSTGADLVDDSFDDIQAVDPSDTIDETTRLKDVRAIRSEAGGAVSIITQRAYDSAMGLGSMPEAADAIVVTLAAGEVLRIRVAFVLLTGTAAADVEALF